MDKKKVKIISSEEETNGKAVRITTEDEDGVQSHIILTADFCHYCKDDLATEFEKFMKAQGYVIKRN